MATIKTYERHPFDTRVPHGDDFHLDFLARAGHVPAQAYPTPWNVLASGFRTIDDTEPPQRDDNADHFLHHAPYHAEIGSGLSMEAGIPPLARLHQLFGVQDSHGRSLFDLGDLAHTFAEDPLNAVPALTQQFLADFYSQPTGAHRILADLIAQGVVIAPVLSHNFDSLLERAGIPTVRLRRFDLIIPPVSFSSRARGHLVIGSHADRRLVRQRARHRGIVVYFIDPETLLRGEDKYVLEGTRRDDLHCRRSATQALRLIHNQLRFADSGRRRG